MKKRTDRPEEITQENARAALRRFSRNRKAKDVAALIGWKPSYYSMFMHSTSLPHEDTLKAIIKAVKSADRGIG